MTKKEFQLILSICNQTNREVQKINKDLDSIKARAEAAQKALDFSKAAKAFQDIGNKMSLYVTVPLLALSGLAIGATSDFKEMDSAFGVLFDNMADQNREWAKDTADTLNRSKTDIMDYMSSYQQLFVPLGFDRGQAADMSKTMSTLAVDVASFKNIASEKEVVNSFISGIIGNTEAVRKYGIVITEATLNSELLKMGIQGGTRAATEQQKVMARMNMILAATKDAQGDAARTADSFANQQKAVAAKAKEVALAFGELLLPIIADLLDYVKKLLDWFLKLDDSQKKMIVTLGLVAAATGPVIKGFGGILNIVSNIAKINMGTLFKILGSGAGIAGVAGASILALAGYAGIFSQQIKDADDAFNAQVHAMAAADEAARNLTDKTYPELLEMYRLLKAASKDASDPQMAKVLNAISENAEIASKSLSDYAKAMRDANAEMKKTLNQQLDIRLDALDVQRQALLLQKEEIEKQRQLAQDKAAIVKREIDLNQKDFKATNTEIKFIEKIIQLKKQAANIEKSIKAGTFQKDFAQDLKFFSENYQISPDKLLKQLQDGLKPNPRLLADFRNGADKIKDALTELTKETPSLINNIVPVNQFSTVEKALSNLRDSYTAEILQSNELQNNLKTSIDTITLTENEAAQKLQEINAQLESLATEKESINQSRQGIDPLTGLSGDQEAILKAKEEIEKAFSEIEKRYKVFGKEVDVTREKHQVLSTTINKLIETGLLPEGAVIQQLIKDYGKFMNIANNPSVEIWDNFQKGLDSLDLQKLYGIIDQTTLIQERSALAEQALKQLADIGYGKTIEELNKINELLVYRQNTSPAKALTAFQKAFEDAFKDFSDKKDKQSIYDDTVKEINNLKPLENSLPAGMQERLKILQQMKKDLAYQEYQEKWQGQMTGWDNQLQEGAYKASPETGMLYEAAGGLTGILNTVSDGLGGVAGEALKMTATMGPLGLVLLGVKLIMEGFFAVVGPAINAVLVPLVSFLHTVGSVIGQLLLPVLAALAPWFQVICVILQTGILPFLEMLSPIFSYFVFVLEILLPIIKFLAVAFEILMSPVRFVADLLKWLGDWITALGRNIGEVIDFIFSFGTNAIEWHSAGEFSSDAFTGLEERIKKIMAIQTDSNAPGFNDIAWEDSTGYGQGAQYTQGRTINVNIYFYDTIFMGDPGGIRAFSLVVRDEIKAAEALGY